MQAFQHNLDNYLAIDDARIYFEEIGDKSLPALLILHGGMSNIEQFNAIISLLQSKFRIIGIDSRGHGKSTLGSCELTFALLQREVERVLEHLNISSLSIVGFSNGGTIAYRLATFSNLKIERLITIGAPWNTAHLEPLIPLYSALTVEDWQKHCAGDYEQYQRLNPEPDINKFFRIAMNLGIDKGNTRPNKDIKNITCPMLVIRGEYDPIVSKENIAELKMLLPSALTIEIPSVGHDDALISQKDILVKEMLKFLEG